jgi:hypothetical protein
MAHGAWRSNCEVPYIFGGVLGQNLIILKPVYSSNYILNNILLEKDRIFFSRKE